MLSAVNDVMCCCAGMFTVLRSCHGYCYRYITIRSHYLLVCLSMCLAAFFLVHILYEFCDHKYMHRKIPMHMHAFQWSRCKGVVAPLHLRAQFSETHRPVHVFCSVVLTGS